MSNELKQLQAQLEALRAENEALKAQADSPRLNLRVNAKTGYVEVYGIPGKGGYSLSCTPQGWDYLLSEPIANSLRKFVSDNRKLSEAKINAYRSA